jgi:hypothetical protein
MLPDYPLSRAEIVDHTMAGKGNSAQATDTQKHLFDAWPLPFRLRTCPVIVHFYAPLR